MNFANDATNGLLLWSTMTLAAGFLLGVGFRFAKAVLDR